MFTASFCRALLDELEHFECSNLPKGRPNTMNNYGVGEASAGAGGPQPPGSSACVSPPVPKTAWQGRLAGVQDFLHSSQDPLAGWRGPCNPVPLPRCCSMNWALTSPW